MPPSLAQIQERAGPAPKPEDIKASNIVHLYSEVSLSRGAQHHGVSVHAMPRRHTTSGVQNHPRPDTRGSTTVPRPSRSSAPARSPAPAASVHPAAPPALHPLLLALRQGLRPSIAACIGHLFALGCVRCGAPGGTRKDGRGRPPALLIIAFMTINASIRPQKICHGCRAAVRGRVGAIRQLGAGRPAVVPARAGGRRSG